MILGIDIETYSSVDLLKQGVYRYSESPDFEVLLFGYAINDEPVQVIDLTIDRLPDDIRSMLMDPDVVKVAYNANFERVCLSRYLEVEGFLHPEQWRCTMVHATELGLPRSLAEVGRALGLTSDKAKMEEGKPLIQYFCKPCKPTKKNGGRTRNLPQHDPEKWATFVEYNRRDVEVERTIRGMLESRPVQPHEWQVYWLDQRINDRGTLVDGDLVDNAIQISLEHSAELTNEAVNLTGLENVNSVAQLKGWLGVEGSLDKKALKALRESGSLDAKADRMLAIRQELGKTSVSKYEAMQRGACRDGRVRGLFQFYGASRTGRWAGRQVQVQNLPQNHLPDLDVARGIVLDGDRFGLQALFGNVPSVLSELIRTAFIAPKGKTFAVADFSAIEARVIAWMSNEKWRLKVFEEGGDIYCASASQMFKVPVVKHGENGHLRQKGKIAELALGYGGSVGAMQSMGALEMGLAEEELKPIVDAWRAANPAVTALWWAVDGLMREAMTKPGTVAVLKIAGGKAKLKARRTKSIFSIELPSGREICYWHPTIELNKFGQESLMYWSTEAGAWTKVESYGPKLVENITQAIARDCLAEAMLQVSMVYPRIVMHVHDEMIVEVPKDGAEEALSMIQHTMGLPLRWAPGLLLRGDGYLTDYYRKD